ncbi:MAG: ABC transporter permease subunit [Bacteroidales bacterium]|nr:ABC transporter permease subunit [Bacteroidales bacterium]
MILYLISTADTSSIITAIIEQLPEKLRIFLNDSFFNTLSFQGAAAFGFNHPLVLALLAINAINIPLHHITREMESGTLELLLAHPFKRHSFIISLWVSGCLILFTIILAALIGSLSAIAIFHHLSQEIITKMMQISFNQWLLFILIMSYTMIITTFGEKGNKTGNISAVLTLIFYLLHFLSQLWESIAFIKPFNIFTYYEPQKLMFNHGNFLTDISILSSLILVCLFISLWQFGRRDIS